MSMRQDALAATAEMISAIEKIGASNRSGRAVATVGRIDCLPNTSNVIPGFCRFALDVRDSDAQVLDEVVQTIYETCHNIAESRNVTLQIIASPRTPPVHLPENIKVLLERSAISRHMPYMRLTSGAVHDAAVMSHVTDVGMLFVPSKEGRSHVPEESTEYSDMYACTMILHDVVTALCR